MHFRELCDLPLYYLLTGVMQLATMLSAFVALGCETISHCPSGEPNHKQPLKEILELTLSSIYFSFIYIIIIS